MMAGIERFEFHECNKLGQLQTVFSVYKKSIAGKTETTAVVQAVVAETWEYEDYVFEFGHEVVADVQRRRTIVQVVHLDQHVDVVAYLS